MPEDRNILIEDDQGNRYFPHTKATNLTVSDGSSADDAIKAVNAATSAVMANTHIKRDSAGRAKVAAPSASDDIARKAEIDALSNTTSGFVFGNAETATVMFNSTGVDSITKSGFYYVLTNTTNLPLAANSYVIHNNIHNGATHAVQYCVPNHTDRIFFRRKINSVWQPWVEIARTDSITPESTSNIAAITDASVSGETYPNGVTTFTITAGSVGYPYQYATVLNIKNSLNRFTQFVFKNGDTENGGFFRHWFNAKGWSPWMELWHSGNNLASKQVSYGYQRLQSGIVIQWSYHRPGSTGVYTQTFPLTFSSVLSVQITPRADGGKVGNVGVSGVTNSNYKVTISGDTDGFDMFAVGYVN